MQTKICGYILAAVTLISAGPAAQAAPAPKPAVVFAKASATQAPVVVKLGPAMQEEYTGGEPAERTTTYLTGETAQKPAASKTASQPQG